jgi:hypothetical protein
MNLAPENVCGNRQASPDGTDLVHGIASGALRLTERHQ